MNELPLWVCGSPRALNTEQKSISHCCRLYESEHSYCFTIFNSPLGTFIRDSRANKLSTECPSFLVLRLWYNQTMGVPNNKYKVMTANE